MPLTIDPPLLNSANPWATDLSHLRPLYASPHTGAITTRTSLPKGFPHDDAVNQYTFFDLASQKPGTNKTNPAAGDSGSLNTLGYSPIPLSGYLEFIKTISDEARSSNGKLRTDKPVIISVTGTIHEVAECYRQISAHQALVCMPLAMEINLSCPNIPNKPPPAYSKERLAEYLSVLGPLASGSSAVPIGIKTPPYTHASQFETLIAALRDAATACPVAFVTATNTLAPSLVLDPASLGPALGSAGGLGLGGMAGAPIHPLALGNVLTISEQLRLHPELRHVRVIGVGGVEDADGFRRMKRVGAEAVGVGTALGRFGVGVFARIRGGLGGGGGGAKL